MKIVVVAPVHIYDDIRVFRKEAVTLAQAGHEVILYARTPDGRPLVRDGVTVKPVRHSSRLSRFAQLPALARRVYKERADVYHIHNPDTLPIGFALRHRGCRVIYDTHEDFRSEILLRQWLPTMARRPAAALVAKLERRAGREFDAVIVTQPQLVRRIPEAVVIGNPPLVDAASAELAAEARERWLLAQSADEPLVLGYIGGVSADRGLWRMLDLVAALARSGPARLLLIGPAVNDKALAGARTRPEWRFVDYRGQLPQEEAFAELAKAHLGLILFEDVASHRFVDPNKIYEYLAVGLPFVATAFPGWVERLGAADVGLFVDAGADLAETADKIRALASDRPALAAAGHRAVRFVSAEYSWQANGAPELLRVYD
ncbi:MAG: glycosyltransferase [Candidatus Nanopelagicales bacterium]|nr:glycosyltransferase [Candidatus Nanopelagicales bacterium]MDZ4250377.1 glycosyltransferase [Candidatus Nanopelagicales bacterium]MDZ7576657.1 glycosyltransferase [Candidatus Nanopelagicales bacterium]